MHNTKERSRGLWNERTVAWYQRANGRSDYAERFLGAIPDLLARSRPALDVGAGFGALALPLARLMERVTAVEPAPAMAAALRGAAARARLDNVTVIEATWGGAPVAASSEYVTLISIAPARNRVQVTNSRPVSGSTVIHSLS